MINMTFTQKALGFTGFYGLCAVTQLLGSYLTFQSVTTWYVTLNKPWFNPPGWTFGVVWTLLYILLALAAWQVWKKDGFAKAKVVLGLWGWQLVLNVGWSALFFANRQVEAAFYLIAFTWLCQAPTLWLFYKHSKLAGVLLTPYFLWLSFAAVLNFSIWRLN
ncbi:MAG: tryptophan-rich sensory protein [Vampirovibrio sp.]|nr:tryptophan-rich sensory protein [Vampirovibrio sp.]